MEGREGKGKVRRCRRWEEMTVLNRQTEEQTDSQTEEQIDGQRGVEGTHIRMLPPSSRLKSDQ